MFNVITALALVLACFPGSLWSQTNLLPLLRGETMRRVGVGGQQVKLSHNNCEAVAVEIRDIEFRKLVARILKLPDEALVHHRIFFGSECNLQVSSLGISNENLEALCEVLKEYVRSRSIGHTAQYALASLRQRLLNRQPEEDGFRERLLEAFPYLPRDWVKEDPFKQTTPIPTNLVISKTFVVIDGEIAWVYTVPPANRHVGEIKVDAQGFDPKLKPKFDAAEAEAKQNLKKRGIKMGFGYVNRLSHEVGEILRQKYGIKRRSFRELNPGIIAD